MIEIGRRGFITGLAALVAAPAVIRVAPLMPISVRHTPLYVPVSWLSKVVSPSLAELKAHGWSRPMSDTWVDVHDYDPGYVETWARKLEDVEDLWIRWS